MIPFLGTSFGSLNTLQDSPKSPPVSAISHMSAIGGYSGLFRLPTTEVTRDGEMVFGIGTGAIVPDVTVKEVSPQSDNYSAMVGFLPGLEVGLSFLTPSLFNGIIEDRTVAVKYQIPLPQALGWSVALGSTDVDGTRRRASDYVVAGKRLGAFSATLGAARGELRGAMGGLSWRLNPYVSLAAERTGSLTIAGVQGHWRNLAATAGIDQNRRTIAGAAYAISLGRTRLEPEASSTDSPQALADRASRIGQGDASAELIGDELNLTYEDVDARHPIQTLAAILQAAVESDPRAKHLKLTVMRFGIPLVTMSGRMDQIRSYLQGYSDDKEFLRNVEIVSAKNGGDDENAPAPLTTLVTMAPVLHYELGVQNSLPNSEGVRFRSFTNLPLGLIGATLSEVNLNNSFGSRGNAPAASFGIYKVAPLSTDLHIMAGLERTPELKESGAFEIAYRPSNTSMWIEGGYRHTFSSDITNRERRFITVGANINPTLYVWARNEKFQGGDTGNSIGAGRRFGDTRINLDELIVRDSNGDYKRLGVIFQLPLPNLGANFGRVRVATANYGEFSYRPSVHVTAALGRGISPTSVLSLTEDVQGRRDLTAQYVREAIKQLRYK